MLMDLETNHTLKDAEMLALLELLFDTYHFHEMPTPESPFLQVAYQRLIHIINKNLSGIDREKLVKVIGAIYFTTRRRTEGRREHLSFLASYPIRLYEH